MDILPQGFTLTDVLIAIAFIGMGAIMIVPNL
jgi:type II secretory pathway component PulJ